VNHYEWILSLLLGCLGCGRGSGSQRVRWRKNGGARSGEYELIVEGLGDKSQDS
jgi:phage terminase large subunit-like protein